MIGELFETGEVEKEGNEGRQRPRVHDEYKIPGREYTLMPEVLEDLGCSVLKARLRALGGKLGGNKPEISRNSSSAYVTARQ